jgi:hypothetical protein
MDLRKRLLLIIGGTVFFIALIIASILLRKYSPEEVSTEAETNTETEEAQAPATIDSVLSPTQNDTVATTNVPTTPVPTPQTPEEKQALYARQVARDFVERFLSFSNKNDNKHLDDVQVLVTPTMWDWIKTQTAAGIVSEQTKVVSTSLISLDGDAVSVAIGIQQVITDGNGTKTEYKKGRVDLLRLNGQWKLNGLFWE